MRIVFNSSGLRESRFVLNSPVWRMGMQSMRLCFRVVKAIGF